MRIREVTHINVEITYRYDDDDSIDYYMSMGASGDPVHWCNKRTCTTLTMYGIGDNFFSIPGFLPFDISNPEKSLRSYLKVLLLQ
jgi:hypothetical protein